MRNAMFKLRQKLSLGFGGLLLIILIIGGQSILRLTRLGSSIDIILRENYRSVIACQGMKEALERIDSGLLFVFLSEKRQGTDLVRQNEAAFEKSLQAELDNITMPGEGDKARRLSDLYTRFRGITDGLLNEPALAEKQRKVYFDELFPIFLQIKETADDILQLNQKNMSDANDTARRSAAAARRQMYVFLAGGLLLAGAFVFFTRGWILRPIQALTASAEEIKKGNLELVVPIHSRDEIGRLSETFNEMAAALRQIRRTDQIKLARIQRATEYAFKSLPDAIAIVDLEGNVDVATDMAQQAFGLKPNVRLHNLPYRWLKEIFAGVFKNGKPREPKDDRTVIQHFVAGEERYFRPEAIPILDYEKRPTGVVLSLKDVTQEREQEDLKRGLISTVSHQLKSPLTSIRMAIHLLLEEKIGTLNAQQAELLVAARDDSVRLHSILNNLLDISRMESGKAKLNYGPISPAEMVFNAVEACRPEAKDRGLTLQTEVPDDVPDVWADPAQINHVFANLMSNAMKYTAAGGQVKVRAQADDRAVTFEVSDTGSGIPRQYLEHVFERFFQVPGQETGKGVGLGLAIVKEIVEAHGGSVHAESRVGEGSTFSFSLPRADRVPGEAPRP
jgi:NtrC-family two-component system sensor histidine kinase KinB